MRFSTPSSFNPGSPGGGGGISGTITDTQVAFGSGTDTISGSNTLKFDYTNGFFGRVSSGSPEAPLHAKGTGSEMLRLQTTTTFPVYLRFKSGTADDLARLVGISIAGNGGELSFYTKNADSNSSSSASERGRFDNNGNFWVGSGHTINATRSIVVGTNNTLNISNNPGAVFGDNNTLSYAWTFVSGYGNSVGYQSSGIIGQSNVIGSGGYACVAFGQDNNINNCNGAIAGGSSIYLSGNAYFGFGGNHDVSGARSGALGKGMTVTGNDSIGVGINSTGQTLSEANTFGIFGGKELLKTHFSYAGSGMYRETAAVTTTNDAVTTLWSKTLSDNTVYRMYVGISARRSDSGTENGIFERVFKVYRQGAGAVLGTVTTPWADDQTSMAGLITIDVSSNDIRVRVTGEAAKTFEWAGEIKYQSISTSS